MEKGNWECRIGAYRESLAREEKSRATIDKYVRDAGAFLRFLGPGGEITREAVVAYKEKLVGRYALASVNSMLAAVNSFLAHSGLGEYRVKPLKIQRRIFCDREAELTREEYLALLGTAKKQGKERLWLVLQTLCSTGIRVGELGFITVEAVGRGRATVSCKGKSRLVFLPEKLCERLGRFAGREGIASGSVFVTKGGKALDRSNIWHEMKSLCGPAGVSPRKVFPHNLRHLFARCYYRREKDLARLADVLGHASVETTRIYILTSGEEQERQIGALGLLAS